jgi:hypothetical protein
MRPSCLRRYVTSRKIVGWIPDKVIGFFKSIQPHNGSGFDSASNRNEYLENEVLPSRKADNFTAICVAIV